MPKYIPDAAMDYYLDKFATSTRQTVCSAQPANFAGIAAVQLAQKTGLTTAAFTKADGTTSGRKLTIQANPALSVTASNTATHVCLDDGTTLWHVTTCTSQALTSGGTVDVPSYVIDEIADVA